VKVATATISRLCVDFGLPRLRRIKRRRTGCHLRLFEKASPGESVQVDVKKATGAPGNSSQPYPYRNIHKYTQQIVETFGPARTFWGTDITRMPCSWRQCVTMFTEEMPFLKGRDPELVMGRALCDWIGWTLDG
jgi:hypothetical protein